MMSQLSLPAEERWMTSAEHFDQSLAALCSARSSLTTLSLSGNQTASTRAADLGDALKKNTSLTKLVLESCHITSLDVALLWEGLGASRSLCDLHLRDNPLGDEGSRRLSSVLTLTRSLARLDINGCQLTSAACRPLCHGMAVCGSLTELDLGENALGDAGARMLINAVSEATGLRRLLLENCAIGADGAAAFGHALSAPLSPRLVELHLARNSCIGDQCVLKPGRGLAQTRLERCACGACALVAAMLDSANPCTLALLDLSHCGLAHATTASIREALARWARVMKTQRKTASKHIRLAEWGGMLAEKSLDRNAWRACVPARTWSVQEDWGGQQRRAEGEGEAERQRRVQAAPPSAGATPSRSSRSRPRLKTLVTKHQLGNSTAPPPSSTTPNVTTHGAGPDGAGGLELFSALSLSLALSDSQRQHYAYLQGRLQEDSEALEDILRAQEQQMLNGNNNTDSAANTNHAPGTDKTRSPADAHALLIAELKAREDILRQQLAGSRRAHPSARPRPRGEDVAAPAGGAASHQEARQEGGRQPQAEQQTPGAAREAGESQAEAERAQAARNLIQQLEWAQQERRLRERIVMVHAELRRVASLQLS
jgi:hypothetical protein